MSYKVAEQDPHSMGPSYKIRNIAGSNCDFQIPWGLTLNSPYHMAPALRQND